VLKNIIKKEGGFTLLELLIVIVIIGILALLIIPNITSAPKKARDTQRKTDLRAIQKGMEEYFTSNNAYPTATSDLSAGTTPIMKTIPTDPKNSGVYVYTYTNGTPAGGYTLKACLENSGDNGQFVTADTSCTGTDKAFTLLNNN
jgi:type II secretion system protein G